MIDFFDDAARVSDRQGIFWNVFRYNASGSYNGTIAYRYARKDDDASAEPAAVSDPNRQRVSAAKVLLRFRIPVRREPFRQFHGMGCGVKLDIGCDQNIIPDSDRITVYKCTIHIDGHMIADQNVSSVIAEKRRCDRHVCSDFME